jgi:hypothetical protein
MFKDKTTNRLILVFLIIVGLIILLGQCNNPNGEVKEVKTTDTVYVPSVDTVRSIPTLVKTIETRIDSFIQYEVVENPITHEKYNQLVDAANELYRDHTNTKIYSDTQNLKYGQLVINDTVTRNELIGRSIITDFKIPVVTNNIKDKPKGELYFGFGGGYNYRDSVVSFTPASLLWKTKKNVLVELDWSIDTKGGKQVRAKVYPFNRTR